MTGSSALRFTLFWLIVAVLGATFLSRFVLVTLLAVRVGIPLLLACAGLVAVAGTGALLLRALERTSGLAAVPTRSVAWYIVTGYPLFGAICFLIGLASTSRVVMSLLLLVTIVIAARVLRPLMPAVGSFSGGAASAAGLVVISAAILPVLGLAQLPASTLDELAYHLAVPQTWVVEGRVVDLPLLSHSYFPLGTESADLPLLAILGTDGAIASHFLHLFVAIATMFLIYEWLRRRIGHAAALLSLASIVTCPALILTAGWSWNDWPVTGTAVALLLALEDLSCAATRRHAAAAAIALAAGMLTKYTFYPVGAGLLLACILASSEARRRIREILPVLAAGLLAGSVFPLRNLILTGNPFAPFLEDHAPAVSHFRQAGTTLAKAANYIFDGNLIDESLGVTLLILAAAAVPAWNGLRSDRFLAWSWTITLATGAGLYVLGPSSRVFLPWLVILAMIGAVALEQTLETGVHRRLVRTVILVLCAAQLFLVWYYAATLDPFATLSGRQTDEEYLARHRSSFAASQAVNRTISEDSKLLAVGLNELFWFSVPVRGGGNFDGPRVAAYLDSPSADTLRAKLQQHGFTHVVLFPEGIRTEAQASNQRRDERETYLPPATLTNLRTVVEQHADLVASENGAIVYELR